MESPAHGHAGEKHADWLKILAIGTTLATGAVIVAPYVLPMVGFGSAELAEESMLILHGTGLGNGLAGAVNTAINAVPLVGPVLAKGGWAAAAAVGGLGLGGALLGRYVSKHEDGTRRIRWGKLITTAAFATSALIALPTALTGISVGLVYLSAVFSGVELASSVVTLMSKTLGSIGAMNATTGMAGVATMLTHLFTCGMSMLPAALSIAYWRDGERETDARAETKCTDGTVTAAMAVDRPLASGRPCRATLLLKDSRTDRPITADELAVVHTEKLHLFVADSSLRDYHHIHPQPTGNPGEFVFQFTPKTANNYAAWADFTLLKDNRNHRLKTQMASASGRNVRPSVRMNSHAEWDGIAYTLTTSEPLRVGAGCIVEVNVADTRGNPVRDLEPVMGAFAHLVGFGADGNSLIHTHPLGAEPMHDGERGGPRLRFHVEPDTAGPVQFYLQVKRGGQDVYVPFGQRVQPPLLAVERTQAGGHAAHMHI